MYTLILSDLHLGARNSRTDLLASLLRGGFDRLVLNGDTVDSLNFERFRSADWRVVSLLRKIAQDRQLVLIRGNHDGRLDADGGYGSLDVMAQLLGVELHEEYELETAHGWYLVLHGDRFDHTLNLTWIGDAADWCYHQIQRVNRPPARWLKRRVKHLGGVADAVRTGAIAYARQRGCAGVITGHTHYREDDRVDGLHYLNTGCWVDRDCSYVRIEDGEARLVPWLGEPSLPRRQLCRNAE